MGSNYYLVRQKDALSESVVYCSVVFKHFINREFVQCRIDKIFSLKNILSSLNHVLITRHATST